MPTDESLAQLSNQLIYSAMIVYALALGAFLLDLAGRGPGRKSDRPSGGGAGDARVLVGAGTAGPVVATSADRVDDLGGTQSRMSGTASRGGVAFPAYRHPGSRALGVAMALMWLAFALHLGGVTARGFSAHRAPWGNMYEFSVSGAVVVTGVFLVVVLKRDLRYLGAFVAGPVLLTLGLAVTVLYAASGPLVPALRSFWLVIHVSVAFVASALFTLGFSTTVLHLVQARREALRSSGRTLRRGAFMDRLPSSEELERSSYRLHAVAFPLWTFTLLAGAIWAESAWGRYWNWDPKEVWTFVVWVVYAGYLHARTTRGWDGRRAAYLALAGYACVLFNFLGVNIFLFGLHSYAGV